MGGGSNNLIVSVLPADATDKSITWSTSNAAVATVNGGTVTPVGAGTATITAASSNGKRGSCAVTVAAAKVAVTGVALNKSSLELTEGDTETLTATVSPENATDRSVTWKSSDETIATVAEGKITALKAGTATITVTTTDGAKKAECALKVNNKIVAVESVTLNKSTLDIYIGDSETLSATVKPDNATDKTLTWSTSDETIATVAEGKITALKAGTATITATAGEKSAECAVKVSNIEATSLALSKATLEMYEGDSYTIVATIQPDNVTDKTIDWKSSDESVATVEGGTVKALKVGQTTVTATTGTLSKSCEINVVEKPSINFPDLQFRKYMLANFDTNHDGNITSDEAELVTEISISSDDALKSLEGIEYCTNLVTLYCNYCHYVTTINLSHNTKLKTFVANYLGSKSGLTELDLSAQINLKELILSYTNFTTIDLSNCTALTRLEIGQQLSSIDLSKCINLEVVSLVGTMTSLDLSKNTKIYNLKVGGNGPTTVDLSPLTELKYLTVQLSDTFATLDVSKNTELTELTLFRLSAVQNPDLKANTKLSSVSIENCSAISEIDLSNAVEQMSYLHVTSTNDPTTVWFRTGQDATKKVLSDYVTIKYK